jgi:hypothetical protein
MKHIHIEDWVIRTQPYPGAISMEIVKKKNKEPQDGARLILALILLVLLYLVGHNILPI